MSSVNKVILVGRVGRDPETRYTAGGDCVTTFSMATSEKFKDKENTVWHNIVAWRKTGEVVGQYVKKGDLLYVEGKIQVDTWEKDGQKKSATKIVIHQLQMLGGKGNGSGQSSGDQRQNRPEDDDFVHEDCNNNGEPSEWDDLPL